MTYISKLYEEARRPPRLANFTLNLQSAKQNLLQATFSFVFLFFGENKSWYFMWIVCQYLFSLEKKIKISSAAVVIGALRVNIQIIFS